MRITSIFWFSFVCLHEAFELGLKMVYAVFFALIVIVAESARIFFENCSTSFYNNSFLATAKKLM